MSLPVRGIGIGVPGITDPETGVVSLAPALDWQDFPLKARLQERYSLPIVVENDVNLAALGEMWFGSESSSCKNLVLIAIGTGIGAGIVLDGNIYSGINHMAGEIGYLVLDRSQLGQQYPGFGAFEQIASGSGIAERARLFSSKHGSTQSSDDMTAEGVFSAARRHEAWAEEIVSETVDYLAQAIAATILMYDPDVVVLGGGVSRSSDLLIQPIIERLRGTIPAIPKLQVSHLGYRAAVLGAVMQLLRVTSNYYILHKYT
jgi:glucokinase